MSLKNDLISGLDDSRNVMRGVLQLIDDDHDIYPDWKIKYVLAYIAGRDNASMTAIQSNQQGNSAAAQDINDYILPSVEALQEADYEEVMREWEETREQLKSMLNELQDTQISKQIITPWGENIVIGDLVYTMIELEKDQADEIMRGMKPNNN